MKNSSVQAVCKGPRTAVFVVGEGRRGIFSESEGTGMLSNAFKERSPFV
ncbi:hypothetical protein [Angelakisella massiliensis]|nr:hypothetical protein [Angelakisella massiliensis]